MMRRNTPAEQRRRRVTQLLQFLAREEIEKMEPTVGRVAKIFALKWGLTQKKVREYLYLFRGLGAIREQRTSKGRMIKVTPFGKKLLAETEEEEKMPKPISIPGFEP